MARLGRYFIKGQALHVIQRGNDRRPVFCWYFAGVEIQAL